MVTGDLWGAERKICDRLSIESVSFLYIEKSKMPKSNYWEVCTSK